MYIRTVFWFVCSCLIAHTFGSAQNGFLGKEAFSPFAPASDPGKMREAMPRLFEAFDAEQQQQPNVQPGQMGGGSAPSANIQLLPEGEEEDLSFVGGFFSSISMILVSELGDKTFFIAAILAMKNNRVVVFLSAISALAVMTVLSAAMGFALPNVLPRQYTVLVSIALFLFFGVRLLLDARSMGNDNAGMAEELHEVEEELAEASQADIMEGGGKRKQKKSPKSVLSGLLSPIFLQGFSMTFLAEWGDRSQIATIALAAAKNPYGVTLGGILGHAMCTGLAVIGGKMLATRISERMVTTIGGALFLLFAMHSIYGEVTKP